METASIEVALAQPWLFARLGISALALGLAFAALLPAARARGADDRRVELAAALLGAALRVELGALALHGLAAQALADVVPGAMCSQGVLAASPWGMRSSAAAIFAALACAAAGGVSAVDARSPYGSALGALRGALLLALAATALDLHASLRFAATLDLEVAVSCCTREVATATAATAAAPHGPGGLPVALAGLTAVISMSLARKRFVMNLFLAGVMLPAAAQATRDLVAPSVLGHADHRCVYCAAAAPPFGTLAVVSLVALALLCARGLAALALRGVHPEAADAVLVETVAGLRWAEGAWLFAALGAVGAWAITHGSLAWR